MVYIYTDETCQKAGPASGHHTTLACKRFPWEKVEQLDLKVIFLSPRVLDPQYFSPMLLDLFVAYQNLGKHNRKPMFWQKAEQDGMYVKVIRIVV